MVSLSDLVQQALALLVSNDTRLWEIIGLSLQVSLSALLIALVVGLPMAMVLTVYRFRGDRILRVLIDTFMALPPVVVGLIVYLLLSRMGPLGVWGLLYTPTAMVIAQAILITPIVVALALQAFTPHWHRIGEQLHVLGIQPWQRLAIMLNEARVGVLTVVLAAFGRAIAEIGAVMIVGGNIEHHTRVMTTTIAMETQQGNLQLALALGIVLIFIALLVNIIGHTINAFSRHHTPTHTRTH